MRWLAVIWKSSAERIRSAKGGSPLIGLESVVASAALALVALLPTVESLSRSLFGRGLYSSSEYVQHLVLWVAFLGGMITSREGQHLALSATADLLRVRPKAVVRSATGFLAVAISAALSMAALSFVLIGFQPDRTVGPIPVQIVGLIMPIGYAVIAVRFARDMKGSRLRWLVVTAAVALALALGWEPLFNALSALFPSAGFLDAIRWPVADSLFVVLRVLHFPLIVLVIVAGAFGLPLFTVLGGLALLLFSHSGGAVEVIPNEAYALLTSPIVPAIPLFTLTGFILSESKAADRLVRFFRVFFGWLKGGPVIVSILVCAFFTTFTGGSGVTILALGGLLSAVLLKSRYAKGFSTGLLTASGSIGLLFPPSLAVIMYGVTALISIKDLFIGALLPGVVMVAAMIAVSLLLSRKVKPEEQERASARAGLGVLYDSLFEILLPVIVLVSYFSGIATLVETAAISVVYTLVVELFVRRDLTFRDVPAILLKCLPVIGGVLVILTVAKGFSFYVVDAEIPVRLTELVHQYVGSRLVFLMLLNLALLVTGCFMDIFSAILVVAPLVIPMGVSYGVHPVHLGVIFLANLELGYLTPPVGINLFLASYRFEEPISRIYRQIVPFLLIQLGSVLLITYVPWLSTGLLKLLGSG